MSVASHRYYRLYDPEPQRHGVIEVDRAEAQNWNEQGWGIFWSVNSFNGPRRKENLRRINAWALDLDSGPKVDQFKRIQMGLVPSLIIESLRGYHIYWIAKDATLDGYRSILTDRLCPFYSGDVRATDVCRILRVPGYFHCKDLDSRFLVKKIHRYPCSYTEQEMCMFYPPSAESIARDIKRQEFEATFKSAASAPRSAQNDGLWQVVWNMDCEDALNRLSGHAAVGGEIFTFKPVSQGKLNLLVNGKSTSCWIDQEKRIGSLAGGGPTIFNWLNWYQRNPKKTVHFMKQIFQELPWSTNQN
jgi:hypothetical protein